MWVELVFQHLVLIADILGLQLLIFDKHGLLAADEIDDIAATGDEASYDEVAQRMQVVMYHCIDSRYVERLVKEYENLSQQVAENPGQDKGKDYFSSRNFDGSLVEVEQTCVDGEKNQQRKEGEKDFIVYVHKLHSGKKRMALKTGEERY